MSFKLRFSEQSVRDIDQALAYTLEQYGNRKYEQYKELIRQALADLAADPQASPARRRPEIHPEARTYHLARRGKRARHLILFRVAEEQFVDIARLLHDSMELREHLPASFD